MASSILCWNCGASLATIPLPLSRHANCPKCFEVLHCCRLCKHYAPGRPGDCAHERADPPVIKESNNFCEFFKPAPDAFKPGVKESAQAAKSEFDSLFATEDGKSDEPDTDIGKDAEDDLFEPNKNKKDKANPLDDLFDD